MVNKCPICDNPVSEEEQHFRAEKLSLLIECGNCGRFELGSQGQHSLDGLEGDGQKRALLSHAIRMRQRGAGHYVPVTSKTIREWIEDSRLPNVAEQAERFLLWLGERLEAEGAGAGVHTRSRELRATLGAITGEDVGFVITGLVAEGLIEGVATGLPGVQAFRLTFRGWTKHDEVKRGHTEGKKAFMAMPFGDAELDAVYTEYFKPAIEATGFDLWRLDEKPEAGVIDNNMVVAIRESRFLLAEVTARNPGALWEAGFAEGEGKPVIYLCHKKKWKKRHFDIAHRQSVKWDPDAPEETARNLKAAVRATFPADATMEDE